MLRSGRSSQGGDSTLRGSDRSMIGVAAGAELIRCCQRALGGRSGIDWRRMSAPCPTLPSAQYICRPSGNNPLPPLVRFLPRNQPSPKSSSLQVVRLRGSHLVLLLVLAIPFNQFYPITLGQAQLVVASCVEVVHDKKERAWHGLACAVPRRHGAGVCSMATRYFATSAV